MSQEADGEVHEDTLALINDELTARLGRQVTSVDRIDTKVTVLTGFLLAATPWVIAIKGKNPALTIIALICAAGALTCGILCLLPHKFTDATGPNIVDARWKSHYELLGQLVGN
jgi:hypothetical protein